MREVVAQLEIPALFLYTALPEFSTQAELPKWRPNPRPPPHAVLGGCCRIKTKPHLFLPFAARY
jgi:hypothetical protein